MSVLSNPRPIALTNGHTEDRTNAQLAVESSVWALQRLMQRPVQFVAATSLTHQDEARIPHFVNAPQFEKSLKKKMQKKGSIQDEARIPPFINSHQFDKAQKRKMQEESSIQQEERSLQPKERSLQQAEQPKRQRVSSESHRQTVSGNSRGLKNPNTWCYHNSVFQALLHTPKIDDWLRGHNCTVAGCLACSLGDLRRVYWKASSDTNRVYQALYRLRDIMLRSQAFRNVNWSWRQQQDAEEFCTLLISALIDGNRTVEPFIQSSFRHEFLKTMICPNCKDKSQNTESNFILQVHFEEAAPLDHLLHTNTFASNLMERRKCDKCNTAIDTKQQVQLSRFPDVLIVQLMRFRGDRSKKTEEIAFTEDLDLTPFTQENTPAKYKLSSVIHHSGTIKDGHYITVARGPGGWVKLNDQEVSRSELQEALDPTEDFTPYILFWTRVEGKGQDRTKESGGVYDGGSTIESIGPREEKAIRRKNDVSFKANGQHSVQSKAENAHHLSNVQIV